MASKGSGSRDVIAHFSTAKLTMGAVGTFGFAILGTIMARDMLFAHPTDDRIKYWLNVWGFAIFFVALAHMIFYAFRAVRAAIESKGVALWLEDGRLVHADKRILDVPVGEILSIEMASQTIYQYAVRPRLVKFIRLRLRNGREAKLPAGAFVENKDDVVEALREKLGLPAGGTEVHQMAL